MLSPHKQLLWARGSRVSSPTMPLSSRMPELKSFELLLEIARAGSLGAAGRELGLSQQAVSARLASLESLTGVQLVLRTPRGSELSSTGVVVAEWAEHLMCTAEWVDTGLAALRQESRSRVRVAASLTVAEHLMPRWLVSMRSNAGQPDGTSPDVILTIANSRAAARSVQQGDADLGFVEGPTVPNGLHSKTVARDELVVIVNPNHKWTRRSQPLSAEELSGTPLVLREPESGTRECLVASLSHRLGPDAGHAPPVLELSSLAAIRAAVVAGAGPAVVSRLSVLDDLALDRLRVIPVADLDLTRRIRAIWPGNRTPPAGAVRDLLQHISRQHSRPSPRADRHVDRAGRTKNAKASPP